MAFAHDPKKLMPHDFLLRYTVVPLIPKFVTPNAITMVRLLLTPVVLWLLYVGNYSIGVPLFIFAACTDALDGSIARLRNQVTDWGSFFDPLADKLLIGSVVLLVVATHVNVVFALIIVAIEALIILGGFHWKRNGRITTANVFGKTKMFLQVVGLTLLLIAVWSGQDLFIPVSVGTLSLATAFAMISLFTYGI